jgi:hypothetical protein
MNSQIIRRVIFGFFTLVFTNLATVSAQSTFGSIVGAVQDAFGGAIPGAAVTVKNLSDNTIRATVSDSAGEYQVLNLRPGSYEIVAAKEGFANATISGATLDARQQLREDLIRIRFLSLMNGSKLAAAGGAGCERHSYCRKEPPSAWRRC